MIVGKFESMGSGRRCGWASRYRLEDKGMAA